MELFITIRYSFMRRNVRRLNREVGSLSAGQGATKRKSPAAGSKASKKAKESAACEEDTAPAEYDELAMQMMAHGSTDASTLSGACSSYIPSPALFFHHLVTHYLFLSHILNVLCLSTLPLRGSNSHSSEHSGQYGGWGWLCRLLRYILPSSSCSES